MVIGLCLGWQPSRAHLVLERLLDLLLKILQARVEALLVAVGIAGAKDVVLVVVAHGVLNPLLAEANAREAEHLGEGLHRVEPIREAKAGKLVLGHSAALHMRSGARRGTAETEIPLGVMLGPVLLVGLVRRVTRVRRRTVRGVLARVVLVVLARVLRVLA